MEHHFKNNFSGAFWLDRCLWHVEYRVTKIFRYRVAICSNQLVKLWNSSSTCSSSGGTMCFFKTDSNAASKLSLELCFRFSFSAADVKNFFETMNLSFNLPILHFFFDIFHLSIACLFNWTEHLCNKTPQFDKLTSLSCCNEDNSKGQVSGLRVTTERIEIVYIE